jgi:parvulin-like peptidyl-prolyl isomerase
MKQIFLFSLTFSCLSLNISYAQIVDKVGTQVITLKEFKSEYERAKANMAALPYAPTQKQFLEDMIRFKVGLQEARKKQITKIPEVKLKMEQELYKALLEVEVAKKVEAIRIKDAEVINYYKSNPNIRTSHILIRYPVDATPAQISEAQNRATKIYNEVIKSKRPFFELVQLYTEDDITKPSGGDLGFQSNINLNSNYYTTANKMKIGDTSLPIRSKFGFHIIRKTGVQDFKNADKNQIRIALFDQKRRDLVDQYFINLKKSYPISITEGLLQ